MAYGADRSAKMDFSDVRPDRRLRAERNPVAGDQGGGRAGAAGGAAGDRVPVAVGGERSKATRVGTSESSLTPVVPSSPLRRQPLPRRRQAGPAVDAGRARRPADARSLGQAIPQGQVRTSRATSTSASRTGSTGPSPASSSSPAIPRPPRASPSSSSNTRSQGLLGPRRRRGRRRTTGTWEDWRSQGARTRRGAKSWPRTATARSSAATATTAVLRSARRRDAARTAAAHRADAPTPRAGGGARLARSAATSCTARDAVRPAGRAARDRVIALHARSLTFLHPIRYEPVTLEAAVPDYWPAGLGRR